MLKLGDYVTFRTDTYDSLRNLIGVVFKVIAIEDDNDRAIISECQRTKLTEENKPTFKRHFNYEIISHNLLTEHFCYLDEYFESFQDEDDWYEDCDEDDCSYGDDYYPETVMLSCLVNTRQMTVIQSKKGNSNLFR